MTPALQYVEIQLSIKSYFLAVLSCLFKVVITNDFCVHSSQNIPLLYLS